MCWVVRVTIESVCSVNCIAWHMRTVPQQQRPRLSISIHQPGRESIHSFSPKTLTSLAITQLRRDDEGGLGSLAEPHQTLVPAADDSSPPQGEVEGLAARNGRVELASTHTSGRGLINGAGVVHAEVVAGCCFLVALSWSRRLSDNQT